MSASAAEGLPVAPAPRSAVLAVLQRIGRSLMLPIAVLPAAGLLLRFGQPDLLGKYHFVNFAILAQAGASSSTPCHCCSPWALPSASRGGRTGPPRWPRWSAIWCSTTSL